MDIKETSSRLLVHVDIAYVSIKQENIQNKHDTRIIIFHTFYVKENNMHKLALPLERYDLHFYYNFFFLSELD